MLRPTPIAVTVLAAALLAACVCAAGEVVVKSFIVLPPRAEPGEAVSVRAAVSDSDQVVAKASVTVRGFPEVQVELKPAAQGTWLAQVTMPAQAPPGAYTLDLTLLDAGGERVKAAGVSSAMIEVVPAGTRRLPDEVARRLGELRQALGALSAWRWKAGDTAGAEQPTFDDSSWTVASPQIVWEGENSVAWFRKEVVIPERAAGFDISGSAVTLLVAVDDEGEVYVNGEPRQKFHWDEGRVVLTQSAQPGEKFLIAVKGINGPGPGRLLSAELRFGALEPLLREVRAYLGDLEFGRAALQHVVAGGEGLRDALATSVAAVNLEALGRGDQKAFLDSLAAARAPLRPIAAALKNYTLHLVGHAHIDMNWLWLWPETVEVCRRTFRQALDFMNQYPEYTFSQSQASTYLAMEQNHPELFAEIARRVKEGRWEVTGGTWVEGDMNLASGEAIVRQVLYAKRYFREKFGVDVRIAWEPDTFGHAWTIPQILKQARIDYYYFTRCGKGLPLFWWQGPDGSRVLAYNLGAYSADVSPGIGNLPLEFQRALGVADAMHVYGVGDHGGGPTREHLESALDLQRRQIFPRVKFSTAHGFFDRVLAQSTEFPVVRDELNFVFEGCYTTHADIKRMNRSSENLLPTAEAFAALAAAYGHPYPRADFVTAWRNTCFNQFHDILDGSAIHESYDYSRGLFDEAQRLGSAALRGALEALTARIDTRGGGTAVIVFNPLAWERSDAVVAAVDLPPGTLRVRVSDNRGREMPAQVVGRDAATGLARVAFTAAEVPSLGYRVFHIAAGSTAGSAPGAATADDSGRIENEFWRLQVDTANGTLTSIYDKRQDLELVPPGARANLFQALFEKPHGMSAWIIGEIARTENLEGPARVEVIERGPARAVIRVTRRWRDSTFTQDLTLYSGVERIDFITTAEWREVGSAEADFPMIKVAFPAALSRAEANCEIPFGAITRPADGREVPALKWADLTGVAAGGVEYGVSLLNDCKYGHDVSGNVLRLTLLRCSYEPDPRPDEGTHHFTYSLYPHRGGWRQAGTVRRAYELNNPLIALTSAPHPGELPAAHSYLRIEPESLIVTALKRAEDSQDLIVRFYESAGSAVQARIVPGFEWSGASQVNLLEEPTGLAVDAGPAAVILEVGPWQIKTLRLGARGAGR